MKYKKNITVVGLGYVGLSMSILLAQSNNIIALDIDRNKINKINKRISPLSDDFMSHYLRTKKLNLEGTLEKDKAYQNAQFIIICVPTDYNHMKKRFDTELIDQIISDILSINNSANIIIKSTIPIGFTEKLRKKFNYENIIFAPEFLREGHALYDNLFPSRIVIGSKNKFAKSFAKLLTNAAIKKNIKLIFTGSTEAESIKLFANTYLAMRIAFFNELDNFSIKKKLNTKEIIDGVSSDTRIGNYYNNPSFGYGGYCLPKDTKQLEANLIGVPTALINSINMSNKLRKKFISEQIIKLKIKKIGIYRLIMKTGSDNFRESAIFSILEYLKKKKIKIYIYEPEIKLKKYHNFEVLNNFKKFKSLCELIIANRLDKKIENINSKIYSRDIFNNN